MPAGQSKRRASADADGQLVHYVYGIGNQWYCADGFRAVGTAVATAWPDDGKSGRSEIHRRLCMQDKFAKDPPPFSSHEFQPDALSIQDALIVLAIRMTGEEISMNPSAKQQLVALARTSPLFALEDYETTEGRINRFVNWAGSPAMDELFPRALDILQGGQRRPALAWAAANALSQQRSDESIALLHHIGQALGFSAEEVEAQLEKNRRESH
jgi:hypothetical protein